MPIIPVKKVSPIKPKSATKSPKTQDPAPTAYVPIKKMTTPRGRIEGQIVKVRRMLEEMRAYKKILAETGAKPDDEDRRKESGLIKNLLSLEKQLDGTHRFKAVAPETKVKKPSPSKRY